MAYTPPTIEEVGLEKYLDQTKDKHQGQGYVDFMKFIEARASTRSIARLMGVDPRTAAKWRSIYVKENERG